MKRFGNEFNLQPSETALFINGQQLNIDSTDMFTLLEHLRDEVKIVEGIAKIGVPSEYVSSVRYILPNPGHSLELNLSL